MMNRNPNAHRGALGFGWPMLVLLAAAALGAWQFTRARSEGEAPAAAYRLVTVERGSIEELVTAQGKLEPKEYVDVGAQVSGQLDRIHVEIGDAVTAGQLLAEIDPRVYESRVQADLARLKTLQAQLAEQQAQIRLAGQIHHRNQRLIEAHAVSQEAVEDSETAWEVAKARAASLAAQIEEAQSTLEGDQTNLSYTKIYAPIAGTVVVQSARAGQTLNATQQAPVIVQLANLDAMTVRAQVAEADVTRVTPGMKVYFTTLGALDRRWQGTVRQLEPSPEVINDVVLYNALVDVDNRDRQLMTGMSTQVFFLLGAADDVPLLPVEALGKRLPGEDDSRGRAYAVKVESGTDLVERVVHIGLMNRTRTEVRAGLDDGERVAVPATESTVGAPPWAAMPRL